MSKPATVEISFCDGEGVLIVYTANGRGGEVMQVEPGGSQIVKLGEFDSLAVSRGHVE